MIMDPPVVIKKAVVGSVKRWQLRELARHHPALDPPTTDLPTHPADGPWRSHLVDFRSTLGRLATPPTSATKPPRQAPWFQAEHRSSVRSAVSGGQWVQTRLAAAGWTDDLRCQRCLRERGTLMHRWSCECLVPAEGWPAREDGQQGIWDALSADRQILLLTRGLFAVRIDLPDPAANADSFAWLLSPLSHPFWTGQCGFSTAV